MTKIILRPIWNDKDHGGWNDFYEFNNKYLGVYIAQTFLKEFRKYGTILSFEICLENVTNVNVYYIIE